jgi:hypothetical protein
LKRTSIAGLLFVLGASAACAQAPVPIEVLSEMSTHLDRVERLVNAEMVLLLGCGLGWVITKLYPKFTKGNAQ